MKTKRTGFFSGLVLLVFLSSAIAKAEDFVCPDHVETTMVMEPLDVTSPWTIRTAHDNGQTLTGMTVFDGPPDEMASLVPDEQGEFPVWIFTAEKPRAMWVECNYYNTPLKLSRVLPDAATRCVARAVGTLSCE